MSALEGWVWLARIQRTQGRKGEVFAKILTDFPEKFSERRCLWLLGPDGVALEGDPGPRKVNLVDHWFHKGGVVLHFAGVDSISLAEELVGRIVSIPRAERKQLVEGDIYISDLVGCVVVDVASTVPVAVGEIEDVDRSTGPVAMLVVRPSGQDAANSADRPGADEILIPFAKDYLKSIDMGAKRVEMSLPKGLVELNRPARG